MSDVCMLLPCDFDSKLAPHELSAKFKEFIEDVKNLRTSDMFYGPIYVHERAGDILETYEFEKYAEAPNGLYKYEVGTTDGDMLGEHHHVVELLAMFMSHVIDCGDTAYLEIVDGCGDRIGYKIECGRYVPLIYFASIDWAKAVETTRKAQEE